MPVALTAFAAQAKSDVTDPGPSMHFVVVRSGAPGCEPDCPEWISAEGGIVAGTPALFRRLLRTLHGRQLPIVVNSPGGDVDAALQLGRLIRKNKLDIAVGATMFYSCDPRIKDCKADDGKEPTYLGVPYAGGTICNSACPLMFSGGIHRVVGEWAFLGVHQITTTYHREKLFYRTTYRVVNGRKKIISTKIVGRKNAGSYKTYEMSKALERQLSAYFKEMGVGQGVLAAMKATPASDIRRIDPGDMLEMKLVTSLDSLDLLTEKTICRRTPAPANCRAMPAKAKPAEVAAAEAGPASPQQATEAALLKKPEPEMRFVLVRGSNPLCNPDCPEWISAQGTIAAGTPDRLRELLDTVDGRRLPIVVNSTGGDVQAALAAGRIIREHRLDVAVARTDFLDCDPVAPGCTAKAGVHAGLTIDSGAECDSACVVMVAGGSRRFVGAGAHLSLHSLGMADRVKAYLDEMAVGPALFPTMQSVLYASHRELSQDEMQKFGLTAGSLSADALTGAAICKRSPRPDNCRVQPDADAEAAAPAKL